MRILIAEDEFTCRKVLSGLLQEYGDCDIAANGKEAIDAFEYALQNNIPYDLVSLDIMMPQLNGHETLDQIRKLEQEYKITVPVKIIMTTPLNDSDNIRKAFISQCEAYLIKPIHKQDLIHQLHVLGLISHSS